MRLFFKVKQKHFQLRNVDWAHWVLVTRESGFTHLEKWVWSLGKVGLVTWSSGFTHSAKWVHSLGKVGSLTRQSGWFYCVFTMFQDNSLGQVGLVTWPSGFGHLVKWVWSLGQVGLVTWNKRSGGMVKEIHGKII